MTVLPPDVLVSDLPVPHFPLKYTRDLHTCGDRHDGTGELGQSLPPTFGDRHDGTSKLGKFLAPSCKLGGNIDGSATSRLGVDLLVSYVPLNCTRDLHTCGDRHDGTGKLG